MDTSHLNLYETLVTDISIFKERRCFVSIKRKQLGPKVKKSAAEIKEAIVKIKERIEELGMKPRSPLQYEQIEEFEKCAKISYQKNILRF